MTIDLRLGDCLQVMKELPDNSIDLIATDPPYYRVKTEQWDRQWDTSAQFLEWIGALCAEWQRILKSNGSLYVFASPQMAARVECKIGETFNVVNALVWKKGNGKDLEGGRHRRIHKEDLRSFHPTTERIIFAEHYGADHIAKGEAGYASKCDELRGFVFEPLRAYLDGERIRAGVERSQIVEWFGARGFPKYVTERHSFSQSQWELPTRENYERLRQCFHELNHGGEYLRREYEDLRREYEDLRRPFAVTKDVPYTDVWNFETVPNRPGKHPCEKPLALMKHIVKTSSREGATVLDCFMGSGVTGEAARTLGRNFIGIERDEKWFAIAQSRITNAQIEMQLGQG